MSQPHNGHPIGHILFVRPGEEATVKIVREFDPHVEVVLVESKSAPHERITPELFSPKSIYAGLEPILGYIRQETEQLAQPTKC